MQALLQNSSLPSEVIDSLRDVGLCLRCCLRFTEISTLSSFSLPENGSSDVTRTPETSLNDASESSDDVVCICCLGILSDSFSKSVLEHLSQAMSSAAYEATSFALRIKIPGSILLREYSVKQYLCEKFPSFRLHRLLELKEALKARLKDPISDACGKIPSSNGSGLAVLIDIRHPDADKEILQIPSMQYRIAKVKYMQQQANVHSNLSGFGTILRALEELKSCPDTIQRPPARLSMKAEATVLMEREPIYIQGRYLKLKRGLSQTPWVLEGKRMSEGSVEEFIGDAILPKFRGKSYKFHSAGREDVDVRMLGNGRPFILQILDAKTADLKLDEYQQLMDTINSTNQGIIEIRDLQSSSKEHFNRLQTGAESKKKTYCCIVWSKMTLTDEVLAPLRGIKDLIIEQHTPIRVLHRRTLMMRPKVIHSVKCETLNLHYMIMHLTTSAGTYVKEFIHGDRGRTQPNVSTLLGDDADIMQLDVLDIVDM